MTYLGTFSFFLIAMPMVCIMMNVQLGEALIDAVIPSIFSSIQLAGVAFYDSSHIGMIFLFCFIFGVICYKIFILRPATVLVARRREKMKKIELMGPSFRGVHPIRNAKSSNGNFDDLTLYLRRVFKLFKHALQHGITGSSRQRVTTRLARYHETIKTWSQMNLPSSSQGVIRFQSVGRTQSYRLFCDEDYSSYSVLTQTEIL